MEQNDNLVPFNDNLQDPNGNWVAEDRIEETPSNQQEIQNDKKALNPQINIYSSEDSPPHGNQTMNEKPKLQLQFENSQNENSENFPPKTISFTATDEREPFAGQYSVSLHGSSASDDISDFVFPGTTPKGKDDNVFEVVQPNSSKDDSFGKSPSNENIGKNTLLSPILRNSARPGRNQSFSGFSSRIVGGGNNSTDSFFSVDKLAPGSTPIAVPQPKTPPARSNAKLLSRAFTLLPGAQSEGNSPIIPITPFSSAINGTVFDEKN